MLPEKKNVGVGGGKFGKNPRFSPNFPPGVVLAEVLLAVALLAICSVVIGSIINSAMQMNIFSRNYLIAQNLATEAIEAVKNVRNTNWLKCPENKAKWLQIKPAAECDKVVVGINNYYIIMQDAVTGMWYLEAKNQPPGELDLTNKAESVNTKYLLYLTTQDINNLQIYTHTSTGNGLSIFFREIKFQNYSDDKSTFRVKVQWREGAKIRELIRNAEIYNYFYD